MRIERSTIAIAAALTLLSPAAGRGAEDSLCVRFAGAGGGETLTLSRGIVMSGELPVTLCGIEPRESYRLALDGEDMERRIATFRLVDSGIRLSGLRLSIAARNAVMPGWGSVHAGRGEAAAADGAALAVSILSFVDAEREHDDLCERLDLLESFVTSASTVDEYERATRAAREAARMVNVQNSERRRLAAVCGALYGWQVIEPFFADAPPRSKPGLERNTILFYGHRESRTKAFVYSLVRPGRGQLYQGKQIRGFLFSTAWLVAGMYTLEYQNRVDEAAAKYNLCVERFEAATTVADKKALASTCELLLARVDEERRDRAVSLAVLAAVWGWNCADVFFGTADARQSRYSLSVDARGAAVAVRF